MGPNNINNIIINININNIIINTNNVDNINNNIGDNSGRFYKSPIKPASASCNINNNMNNAKNNIDKK